MNSTWNYIIRRILYLIPVLLGVCLLIFILFNIAGNDPAAALLGKNATAEQLAEVLDGVGLAKAKAIVEHRKRFGDFKQVDSIESVKGIGESTLEKNRSKIILQ